MISLEFEYDPELWLPVPTEFPDDEGRSPEQWIAAQAAERRRRGFAETDATGALERYFTEVLAVAQDIAADHDGVWALLPDDAPGFVAVALDVANADRNLNDVLSELAGRRPEEYEPAAVVEVHSPGLGDGFLVTRNDIDPDRSVVGTLCYVFRTAGADVTVSGQSYDIALLSWAAPFIRDLVDGITVAAVEPEGLTAS